MLAAAWHWLQAARIVLSLNHTTLHLVTKCPLAHGRTARPGHAVMLAGTENSLIIFVRHKT